MPTRSDFETAAELFTAAAGLINDLAVSTRGVDTSQVVRGGSLGRQVAERVASAASSASLCHLQVSEAAETCVIRADLIAEYELELSAYDRSYNRFRSSTRVYGSDFAAWFRDETGTVRHPGTAPVPPQKPTPPPSAWADVRRP